MPALLINLRQMIADFAMFAERPCRVDIFLGLLHIAAGIVDPAECVPIGIERGHISKVAIGQLIERHISQRVGDCSHRRLSVLLGAIEMRLLK